MNDVTRRPVVEATPAAFVRALLIAAAPGLVIFSAIYMSHAGAAVAVTKPDAFEVLAMLTVIPFLETALVIYPTHIAKQAVRSAAMAALIGGAPLVLLHFVNSWQNALVVAWLFVWSAYCYVALEDRRVSMRTRYAFLFLLHVAWNGITLSIYAFA